MTWEFINVWIDTNSYMPEMDMMDTLQMFYAT